MCFSIRLLRTLLSNPEHILPSNLLAQAFEFIKYKWVTMIPNILLLQNMRHCFFSCYIFLIIFFSFSKHMYIAIYKPPVTGYKAHVTHFSFIVAAFHWYRLIAISANYAVEQVIPNRRGHVPQGNRHLCLPRVSWAWSRLESGCGLWSGLLRTSLVLLGQQAPGGVCFPTHVRTATGTRGNTQCLLRPRFRTCSLSLLPTFHWPNATSVRCRVTFCF